MRADYDASALIADYRMMLKHHESDPSDVSRQSLMFMLGKLSDWAMLGNEVAQAFLDEEGA